MRQGAQKEIRRELERALQQADELINHFTRYMLGTTSYMPEPSAVANCTLRIDKALKQAGARADSQ